MNIEPFRAEHFIEIDPHGPQREVVKHAEDYGRAYETCGNAYTVRRNGRIAGCAGVVRIDSELVLWSVLAADVSMVIAHRVARRFLTLFPGERIRATTPVGFAEGERWLQMLGFQRTGLLPEYENGIDHIGYVREARH